MFEWFSALSPEARRGIIALVAIALLAAVVGARLKFGRRPRYPYYAQKFLLTAGERAFYRVLREATPRGLSIAPKVRLGDLINCSQQNWRAGFGGRIVGKHIDFVLFEADTTAIRLLIELDDRSHDRPDRRERDLFVDRALAAAEVPLLRIRTAPDYDAAALRQAIRGAIAAPA